MHGRAEKWPPEGPTAKYRNLVRGLIVCEVSSCARFACRGGTRVAGWAADVLFICAPHAQSNGVFGHESSNCSFTLKSKSKLQYCMVIMEKPCPPIGPSPLSLPPAHHAAFVPQVLVVNGYFVVELCPSSADLFSMSLGRAFFEWNQLSTRQSILLKA